MPATHDPGGKVRRTVAPDVKSSAVFGGLRNCYRYRLVRSWDSSKRPAMFVMMNPSTADLLVDDPTVAKCAWYARTWGYGGIYVGNTFAYRATDKRLLRLVADPKGPENEKHLIAMAKAAGIVIFAYGQPGCARLRPCGLALAKLVVQKTRIRPYVLRLSKNGTPCHPLYLPNWLKPIIWDLEIGNSRIAEASSNQRGRIPIAR